MALISNRQVCAILKQRSRLLLVTAVATLFLTLQGTALVSAKGRRWVDTHWHRGLSYLKLGWKWVKQSLSRGRKLFFLTSLTTARAPQPATASLQQAEKLLFARTFLVKSPRQLRFLSFVSQSGS